jgi:hypothetical protein
MSMRERQISVPIEPALREFIESEAQRQHRTLAGQIRHLIAEAQRQITEPSAGGRAA